MDYKLLEDRIFSIESGDQFNAVAVDVFRFQYQNNAIYKSFCEALNIKPATVNHYKMIPFLPIEFFKYYKIVSIDAEPEIVFTSSGTTGLQTSIHHLIKTCVYERSFLGAFEKLMGQPEDFHILALLPSYLERGGSSLVFMVDSLIKKSRSQHSGFYLNNLDELHSKLLFLGNDSRKVLLIGVSFALLDLAEKYPHDYQNLIVMETGGMKGRRQELIREDLHQILKSALSVEKIYSEYGMTELLSQAYSKGDGIFSTPPWMKILIRDVNDPLSDSPQNKAGRISVIDLANLYSCSFISTQDLGRELSENEFLVLGRFDHSDVRGCNLLIS